MLAERLLDAEACSLLVERVLKGVSPPLDIAGHRLQINTSLGIALFPDDGTTATDLMKHADAAMYAAKAARRGTFRFFQPSMTEKTARRLRLEAEGCTLLQGYLYAHPLPATMLAEQWLRTNPLHNRPVTCTAP